MKKITEDQIIAIRNFAESLSTCYRNQMKDPTANGFVKASLDYALKTLDIHLQLAELDYQHTRVVGKINEK